MADLTVRQKLLNIQQELHAPKDKYNSFGKYNYRSLEGILEAVKPLLKKYGCTLTFEDSVVHSDHCPMLEIQALLVCADTGDLVKAKSAVGVDIAKKGMDVSQAFGAASSYGRKYTANALFAIDDTKDADDTNTHGKTIDKKEVITKDSPRYAAMLQSVADGKITVKGIKEKVQITKDVEDALKKVQLIKNS